MSLLEVFPIAGSKRPAPNDYTAAADSATNQAISPSQNDDEDAMDISGDDTMVAIGEYCRITKRIKSRATIGQGNGLDAIPVALANKPHIDTVLSTARGCAETLTRISGQSAQCLAEDVEDQAKEVSPTGNKAGLLFSQISTVQLPKQVEYLHAGYSFSSIEIGPNSKYNHAVHAVVRLVGRFNLADIHMKPTIVVLSSMAKFAGRLIAIVEGAKSRIAADKDKWFQYNEMHGVIVPKMPKIEKRIGGGKTLREWDEEQKAKAKVKETAVAVEASKNEREDAMDVNDDDDDFQTMVRRKSENLQAEPDCENEKIRHMPVITVFIARLRVPELAKLYGEQTNATS